MKKLLLCAMLGSGAYAAPAIAADLSYPVKAPPVVVVPVFSWTGFYLGANGGYGGNNFKYPFKAYGDVYEPDDNSDGGDEGGVITRAQPQPQDVPGYDLVDSYDLSGQFKLNSSGFFGGGQIGYNYQFGNGWVAGVETDFQWSGIEGELSGNGNLYDFGDLLGGARFSAGSEVEWFGTIRARLGYAWDRVFLYGTGGAAYGSVKSHGSITLYDGSDSETLSSSKSDTQWGWTVGAGLEYAITDHWTFKTEYLYVDLGSQTLFKDSYSGPLGDDYVNLGAKIDVETTFHTIKAGVNYKW